MIKLKELLKADEIRTAGKAECSAEAERATAPKTAVEWPRLWEGTLEQGSLELRASQLLPWLDQSEGIDNCLAPVGRRWNKAAWNWEPRNCSHGWIQVRALTVALRLWSDVLVDHGGTAGLMEMMPWL